MTRVIEQLQPPPLALSPEQARAGHASFEFLGVRMNPVTFDQMLDAMGKAIAARRRFLLANHNAHSAYLYHRSPGLRRFFGRADLVYVDSMPLVKMARCLGHPIHADCRVTLVDYFEPLLEHAAREKWNIFFVGARPGVAERGFAPFMKRWPDLRVTMHHGYFDATSGSTENEEILSAINAAEADLLLAGLGMPRQEEWIEQNAARLNTPVIWPIGGTLDYFAGEVKTPPRWMGRAGLEWFYRLCSEPSRLWTRYLLEPWALTPRLARDVWHCVWRSNGRARRR